MARWCHYLATKNSIERNAEALGLSPQFLPTAGAEAAEVVASAGSTPRLFPTWQAAASLLLASLSWPCKALNPKIDSKLAGPSPAGLAPPTAFIDQLRRSQDSITAREPEKRHLGDRKASSTRGFLASIARFGVGTSTFSCATTPSYARLPGALDVVCPAVP